MQSGDEPIKICGKFVELNQYKEELIDKYEEDVVNIIQNETIKEYKPKNGIFIGSPKNCKRFVLLIDMTKESSDEVVIPLIDLEYLINILENKNKRYCVDFNNNTLYFELQSKYINSFDISFLDTEEVNIRTTPKNL